jgi:hypothetical protein
MRVILHFVQGDSPTESPRSRAQPGLFAQKL